MYFIISGLKIDVVLYRIRKIRIRIISRIRIRKVYIYIYIPGLKMDVVLYEGRKANHINL